MGSYSSHYFPMNLCVAENKGSVVFWAITSCVMKV